MKQLLLIAFLSFSYLLNAQYAQFPTPGLEFGAIYNCNMYDCADYYNISYIYRYQRDTFICGQVWSDFNGTYLRAEAGKYWYLPYLTNCPDPVLVYDFSKNVGDTIHLADIGDVKVVQTGTFTLNNGEVRKKMVLKYLNAPSGQTFTWIDGIGDANRDFLRNYDWEGGYGQLICVRDSSGILYHNPERPLDCDSLLCPVPVPDIEYTCEGKTFSFVSKSTNTNSVIWDFGDGTTSEETNPVHTYSSPGCYRVFLGGRSLCLPDTTIFTNMLLNVDADHSWIKYEHQPPTSLGKTQFLTPLKGWAIGGQQILRTSDGGAHWDTIPYPGPIRPLTNLHFSDFEHGIIEVQTLDSSYLYGRDLLWTNDGNSFSLVNVTPQQSFTTIERVNDNTAVVAGHYTGIYITHDGGNTWAQYNALSGISLIWDFESPDGGNTIYFNGLNQLWPPYASYFGRSVDGGLSWQLNALPPIQNVGRISFVSPEEGWYSSGKYIYHTTDAGYTWVPQTETPGAVLSLDFADSQHGWACGHLTGMYGTNDGGQNWTQQACTRSSESISGLTAVNDTIAFATTADGFYRFIPSAVTISSCETVSTDTPGNTPENAINCYPNPASEALHLTWDATTINTQVAFTLFSFNGQTVSKNSFPGNKGHHLINIHGLPDGLYFWQMTDINGNNIDCGKVIIFNN